MAEVKILIGGYVKKLADGWLACSSTVLIKDGGLNIIVDPGANKELLIKKINDENLKFEHSSLLVETETGRVVIAGDLFWWLDEEEQKTDIESLISHKDSNGAKDEKALQKNRKKILEMADWIIPGHGKMFKVVK